MEDGIFFLDKERVIFINLKMENYYFLQKEKERRKRKIMIWRTIKTINKNSATRINTIAQLSSAQLLFLNY